MPLPEIFATLMWRHQVIAILPPLILYHLILLVNLYLAVRPHCQHKQHEPWEAEQALSKYLIVRHNLCRVLYHYVPQRQTLMIFKNLFFFRLCKLFATQSYPLIKYKEHFNTVTKSLAPVQASQEQPLINIFILTFNRSDVQRYFNAFSGTLA